MSEIKVSIIVPVYNAGEYLKKCLDSIQDQTYRSFEAILIDDGSLDHSGKICDNYADRDSRFRVYHQDNIGVTRTREVGIEKARGKYIFWCDADDYLDPVLVERVMSEFDKTDSDIVRFGTQDFEVDGVKRPDVCRVYTLKEIRKEVILGDHNAAVLWNFAAKRELWINECAPLEVARSAADGYMAIRLHMKARHIAVISDILYFHLADSPYSISHTFTGKRYMGNFFLWNYRRLMCKQYFPEKLTYCTPRVLSNGVKAFCLSLYFNDLSEAEKREIQEVLTELENEPIPGRYRDKFLRWCIIHKYWMICRYYANQKVEKTKKKNMKMRQHG